jgi:hypothetical protein
LIIYTKYNISHTKLEKEGEGGKEEDKEEKNKIRKEKTRKMIM